MRPALEETMNQTTRVISWITLVGLLAFAPVLAAEKWLHVYVEDEDGNGGETVKVNIPLSMVERMLPLIEIDELQGGKLDVDGDLEGFDLRELADALRDAPDADFVTVVKHGETVRVAKEDDFLVVLADEHDGDGEETVRVRFPLAVLDALVGHGGDQLDLLAALEVLGEYEGEALVDVRSEGSSIRVWIDSSEAGSRR
jgi:hypothetical protein